MCTNTLQPHTLMCSKLALTPVSHSNGDLLVVLHWSLLWMWVAAATASGQNWM
jgi:hypothetical protein